VTDNIFAINPKIHAEFGGFRSICALPIKRFMGKAKTSGCSSIGKMECDKAN
jgi:hypothetical protein